MHSAEQCKLQEMQSWSWQGYNPTVTKGRAVNKGRRQGEKQPTRQLGIAAAVESEGLDPHSAAVGEAVAISSNLLFPNLLSGTMARHRGMHLKSQLHGGPR